MKLFRKLFAICLILALCTTMFSTAFAAVVPDAAIDTSLPASLSLYKYDFTTANADGVLELDSYISIGLPNAAVEQAPAAYAIQGVVFSYVSSHCVIAGHRSWNGIVLFRPIETLSPGDRVFFTNPWETLTYAVVEVKTIAPSEIGTIQIQPGRDLLSLLTCANPNSQRILVICEREEPE